VAEAVEPELAVVAPHPAVADAAEGHVRVGELGQGSGTGAKLEEDPPLQTNAMLIDLDFPCS
jgi:hypothetical protein